jgi:SAM-dependent methyltransferase
MNSPKSAKEPNPFYLSVIERELNLGVISRSDRVLVSCGGDLDRVALLAAGFTDVVISNLAPHGGYEDYHPYVWEHQDIENLEYEDGAFDIAIVHSGLHHCYNPVRAMGELCRVARKQVIAFEPYETWFTRLGAALGYGQQYEDQAVHGCGGASGGVANTEIPNYVYRFNESEVKKFSRALLPFAEAQVRFYRALRVNYGRFRTHRNPFLRISFAIAHPIIRGFARAVPSLNNNLCFVIQKPTAQQDHPWIRRVEGRPTIDSDYLKAKYGDFPTK